MIIKKFPPQRRSIKVAWYSSDPTAVKTVKLYRKKAFRLWFPEITFILRRQYPNCDPELFLYFSVKNKPVFPLLPNVFPRGKVCLEINSDNIDYAIENFWNSQFWQYEDCIGWSCNLMVNDERFPPSLKFLQQWQTWNLEELERYLEELTTTPIYRHLMTKNEFSGFKYLIEDVKNHEKI